MKRHGSGIDEEVKQMADQQQVALLKEGSDIWNRWRREHPDSQVDLRDADLSGVENLLTHSIKVEFQEPFYNFGEIIPISMPGMDLRNMDLSGANLMRAKIGRANFSGANLSKANLIELDLRRADLSGANLSGAYLIGADLREANLLRADLREAHLSRANLSRANLRYAKLNGADLTWAVLSEADLRQTNLMGCLVYAISAWDVQLEDTIQSNLIITPSDEPAITVANLEVAQFIYLLLNNKKIRDIIDTITSKVVLILGRFTSERKVVLNALRKELSRQNYTPVLFDFEKPASRDLTETVNTLAHLARFIVVDLTDPSSAPYEVATIIPQTIVPVQPLLLQEPLMVDGKAVERREYAMFEDLRHRYRWVLPTFRYQDTAELLGSIQAYIIAPAEQKARELTQPK